MRRCPNCSAINEDHYIRCYNCFHSFLSSPQQQTVTGTPRQNVNPNGSPSQFQENFVQQVQPQQPAPQFFAQPNGSAATTVVPVTTDSKKTILLVLLMVSVIIAAGVWYFVHVKHQREQQVTALFALAESTFKRNDYPKASELFQQFVLQHPDNSLSELAQQRLDAIALMETEAQKQRAGRSQQIEETLKRAQIAMNLRRYITPENDNALTHIRAVLAIDPFQKQALDMLNTIGNFYRTEAERDFNRGRYERAKNYYENIQVVYPGDESAGEQIAKIDDLINEEINRRRQIARQNAASQQVARSEQPATNPVSKTAPQQNLPAEKPAENPASNDTGSQPLASLNNTILPPNTPVSTPVDPVETKPANADSASLNAVPEIISVDESQIDGGKKVLLRKAEPVVPRSWNYGGFSRVRAICIVGTDGQVENVEILTPAKYRRLNDLTTETLLKYQYKPATFNGLPTRFKTVEEIVYK